MTICLHFQNHDFLLKLEVLRSIDNFFSIVETESIIYDESFKYYDVLNLLSMARDDYGAINVISDEEREALGLTGPRKPDEEEGLFEINVGLSKKSSRKG